MLFQDIYSSRNRRAEPTTAERADAAIELVALDATDLANSVYTELGLLSPSTASEDQVLEAASSTSTPTGLLSTDTNDNEDDKDHDDDDEELEYKPSSSPTTISASYDPDFELLCVTSLLNDFKNNNLLVEVGEGCHRKNSISSCDAFKTSPKKEKPMEMEDERDEDNTLGLGMMVPYFNPAISSSPFDHPDQLSMTVDSYVHDAVAALCLEDVDFDDVEEETIETNTLAHTMPKTEAETTPTLSAITAEQEFPKTRQVNFAAVNESATRIVLPKPPTATNTKTPKRRSVGTFSDTLTPVLQLKRRVESSIAEVMRSGEKFFSSSTQRPIDTSATSPTTTTTSANISGSKQKVTSGRDSWGIGRISLSASKKNALVQNMRRVDEQAKQISGRQQAPTTNPQSESDEKSVFKPQQQRNSTASFFESALKSSTLSVESVSLRKEKTLKLSAKKSANSSSVFDLFDGRKIGDGNNNTSFFFESTSSYDWWKTPSKQQVNGDLSSLPSLKVCDSIDLSSEIPARQTGTKHESELKDRRRSIDTVSSVSSLKQQQQATSRRLSAPKGSSIKTSPPTAGGSSRQGSSATIPRTPSSSFAGPKSRSSLQSKSAVKCSVDVPLVTNRPLSPHACLLSSTSSSSPTDAQCIQPSLTVSKSPALFRTKKFIFSDPVATPSSSSPAIEVMEQGLIERSAHFVSGSSDYNDQELTSSVFAESSSNPPTPVICENSAAPAPKLLSNVRQSLPNTSILRSKSSSNISVRESSPVSQSSVFSMKTPIKPTLSAEEEKTTRFSTALTSCKTLSKLSSKSGDLGCLGSSRCSRVPVTGPTKKKDPARVASSSLRSSSSSSVSFYRATTGVTSSKDSGAIAVSKATHSISKPSTLTRSDSMTDKHDNKPIPVAPPSRKLSENRMSGVFESSHCVPTNGTQPRCDIVASSKVASRRSSFSTPKKDSPLCEFYPNVEAYVTPFSLSAIGLQEDSPVLHSAVGVATISPCRQLFEKRIHSSNSLNTYSSPDSTIPVHNTTTLHDQELIVLSDEEFIANDRTDRSSSTQGDSSDNLYATGVILSSPTIEYRGDSSSFKNTKIDIIDEGSVGMITSSGARIAPQDSMSKINSFPIATDDENSFQTSCSLSSSSTTPVFPPSIFSADSNHSGHTGIPTGFPIASPPPPLPNFQSPKETLESTRKKSTLTKCSNAPLTAPKISVRSPFKSPRFMLKSSEKRSRDLKDIALSCDNILSSITKVKF